MKRTLFIILSIILASCSKNDPPTVTSPEAITPPSTTPALSFTINPQNHDGGFGNFQVGEIIGYDVVIKDPTPTGASYVLTPIGVSQTKHQIINTDYYFDKTITNKTLISASALILDKETDDFKIKILNPGTFYLEFALQKFVDGKKIGDPVINKQVIFSAVKFFLYVNSGNTGNRYDRDFFMKIDWGNELQDNYFDDPSFTYTYATTYCIDGGGYSGSVSRDVLRFASSRRAGSGTQMWGSLASYNCNGHNGYTVDEIAITYKSKNGTVSGVIRYKNIAINEEYNVL